MSTSKRTDHQPATALEACVELNASDVANSVDPLASLCIKADDAEYIAETRILFLDACRPNFPGGGLDRSKIQAAYRHHKARFGDTHESWIIWRDEVTR